LGAEAITGARVPASTSGKRTEHTKGRRTDYALVKEYGVRA
jgi:hypothetical protein